jgi:hypothetical protein
MEDPIEEMLVHLKAGRKKGVGVKATSTMDEENSQNNHEGEGPFTAA